MKKRTLLTPLVTVLAVLGATMMAEAGVKVEVCHIPPGNADNFHTITISENAVSAHLAHGDLPGSCDANCDALCGDGDACTIDHNSDCETQGCLATPEPVNCDDGLLCTTDSCDSVDGCQYAPIVCDDGDACTTDTCNPMNGQCTETPINCGPLGVCLPSTGMCDFPCDGISCPIHQCHESGTCFLDAGNPACQEGPAVTDGTPCNDGDPGTINDQCTGGVCAGDLSDPCADFVCPPTDPFLGQCREAVCTVSGSGQPECIDGPPLPDGIPCDDFDSSTGNDVCQGGICIGEPILWVAELWCECAGSEFSVVFPGQTCSELASAEECAAFSGLPAELCSVLSCSDL